MKIGNNQPCHCGSGKKYKRCCRDKKARTITIKGSFDRPTTTDCFEFGARDGRIKLFSNGIEQIPDKATSMISYEREKGPKFLSLMPIVGRATHAHVDLGLLQFDRIVSIDTNSKALNIGKVCVVTSVMMTPAKVPANVILKDARPLALEFWNPVDSPERIGWRLAMEALIDTKEYASGDSFGIIVDSELGKLESFNSRDIEILDGFPLPTRMSLIYGNADNKNDSAINKMIYMTDKASDSVHKRIEIAGYKRSGDSFSNYFTDWRQWHDVELST